MDAEEATDVDVGVHYPSDTDGHALMDCPCGAPLPVSIEHVELAKQFAWYPISRHFNRAFYALLREPLKVRGLNQNHANAEIKLLLKHRKCLDLTERQVRGAYGLRHDVCGADGRLKTDDTEFELEEKTPGIKSFTASDWPVIESEALAACATKPLQADVQKELRWVLAKMREWPRFRSAPSQMAIKQWLMLNDPAGIDVAVRDLLKIMWTKRLSPGDTAAKKKIKAFDEDQSTDDVAGEDREAERQRRLFGAEDEQAAVE